MPSSTQQQQPKPSQPPRLTSSRSFLFLSILFLLGIQIQYSSRTLQLEWTRKSLLDQQEELSNLIPHLTVPGGSDRIRELSQPYPPTLLTIAVDSYGSCPENCHFVHTYIPGWVQYQYLNFEKEDDLEAKLAQGPTTHLIVLARTNIVKLSEWAAKRRQQTNHFVALWHMADERVHGGEIDPTYQHFDFVIRNYWRWKVDFNEAFGMNLRALGNHTCGTSAALSSTNDKEPRFGVHWAFLGPHDLHNLLLKEEPTSVWPTAHRPQNCSFQGRKDTPRMQKTRSQMKEAIEAMPELNCSLTFTGGFALGSSKWDYLIGDLQQTKIGICPGGTSVETHRLAETLQMGSVPAVIDQPYMHAPFRDVPAIVGENWTEVVKQMKSLLEEEVAASKAGRQSNLEKLQLDGAKFFRELQDCMKGDVDTLLRMAVDHYLSER